MGGSAIHCAAANGVDDGLTVALHGHAYVAGNTAIFRPEGDQEIAKVIATKQAGAQLAA